jgi:hypothetical protein
MHVVRSPVARAAAAIGSRTRYRGSAARGLQLISAVWDLTAPVKIYIIIIVHIHRNEHEFSCDNSLWPPNPSHCWALTWRTIGPWRTIRPALKDYWLDGPLGTKGVRPLRCLAAADMSRPIQRRWR